MPNRFPSTSKFLIRRLSVVGKYHLTDCLSDRNLGIGTCMNIQVVRAARHSESFGGGLTDRRLECWNGKHPFDISGTCEFHSIAVDPHLSPKPSSCLGKWSQVTTARLRYPSQCCRFFLFIFCMPLKLSPPAGFDYRL